MLSEKLDMLAMFIKFKATIKKEYGHEIGCLCTDRRK